MKRVVAELNDVEHVGKTGTLNRWDYEMEKE